MSVPVNMLQEHCGGRLSVPATMHRSLRFSGLIPFGDEPGARDCVAFPGSSVEGFALYCGRAEVAVAFLKEHPLAYALIVHARQEACQVPASCAVSYTHLIHTDTGAITMSEVSDAHNRGYDNVYASLYWDDVRRQLRCIKVMKALAHTRVLKMIRHESNLYLTDDFEVGRDFGVMARSINLHEVIDQLDSGDGWGNHSLPERKADNLSLIHI